MNSRRSWVVFAVGSFAYLIAVLQRTTLGVAGVDAAERFDSSAAALSALAVVQLVVYASMQVPVGVLIDRFGPRRLVLVGLALMTAGQVVLALSPTLGIAVSGRVLVGAGDAAIFTSVIRLNASWFSGRLVPQVSQWTGNLGQIGQLLSAVPFAAVLHGSGWTPAFLSAAGLGVLALVFAAVFLFDARPRGDSGRATWGDSIAMLSASFRRPGTRLGFWSHFVTQSSGTVFSLLWGYPFLVNGIGLTPQLASGSLTILVCAGIVAGPILGILTARFPTRRSNIVLGIVVLLATVWTLLLLWPGVPPYWLVAMLLVAMGIGGPGSLIGFDFARTFNPQRSLGSANGVVNVGGFLASFVIMFLMGIVLDALAGQSARPSELYSLENFRIAWLVQYVVIGLGVVGLLVARRRTRRRMAEDEGITVAPLWVVLGARWKNRRGGRRLLR